MKEINITGNWIGFYEQFNIRTSFSALIEQAKGKIYFSGTIVDDLLSVKYDALINGAIDSLNIKFSKQYKTRHDDLIDYTGIYQDDDVIVGKWNIPNTSSTGYFEMWKIGAFKKLKEVKKEEFEEIISVAKKDNVLNEVFPITKN